MESIIDWKSCSWGWDREKRNSKLITYQLTLYKKFFCQKHNIDPKIVETHFALLNISTLFFFAVLFNRAK